MSDSEGEDSPGMDLIAQMIQGHEENLQEAITYSVVVWPDASSPQTIEGWGGDRSRNVNAITKGMKTAITGTGKGPCISSHPHHINIMDKLDGTPSFLCMRINFESRADRNLFCQAQLTALRLRAPIAPLPPTPATAHCSHLGTLPPATTPCHHLLPPHQATTPCYHFTSPLPVNITCHPLTPPPLPTCSGHHHLPPPSTTFTYHLLSPSHSTTPYHHLLPPPLSTNRHYNLVPPVLTTTAYHHTASPPSETTPLNQSELHHSTWETHGYMDTFRIL